MKLYRNLCQGLAVISLTTLITTFAIASFAMDEGRKGDAVKDKGGKILGYVSGCVLTTTSPEVILYSDRSLRGIPIAKVPLGNYQPIDYKKGWYKIRAQGWIAWIQDPTGGVKKLAIQKSNCPGKN